MPNTHVDAADELIQTRRRRAFAPRARALGSVPTLTPKQIADSLARLDFKVESPANIDERILKRARGPESRGVNSPQAISTKARRKRQKGRRDFGVTLAAVIAAGLLKPPVRLFRRYKGHNLEAKLHPDGRVEFSGTVYDSGSTAAEYARDQSPAAE